MQKITAKFSLGYRLLHVHREPARQHSFKL